MAGPKRDVVVRTASRSDRRRVAEVLGRAFQVEPVYEWLYPGTGLRARRLPLLLGTFVWRLHPGLGIVEVAVADGEVIGAAVWDRPGAVRAGPVRTARALPGMLRAVGSRLPKLAALGEALEKARPEESHWYLFHLGADPEWQSRGAGTALLRARLEQCDIDGLPAYLECKQSHVPYYARFGFEVIGEVKIDDSLSTLTMWREPAR
ncbi:GNAT family N-acetyltransferase [Amycolatopsis sp. H20-H5]|uniref:GNAT family N-acetyltransferase n=1 Tax=Amycolatopsis sp. H20-H5 TaxID=3046309 RepID=UPI002DBB91DF|nr:GNAT family N-acetyltransferase [Amycolatopsis sp. H20-H5]MEC3979979.1 GNAT family N-acetyltransferase [Amycolatopsis sp. H20-H5]